MSFPPTGSTPGTISVQVALSKGAANTLAVTNGPALGTLTVQPVPGTNGNLVVGKQSGSCLDLFDSTITNGTQAELWDCNGGSNQAWTYTSRKELVVYGNKCLDAYDSGNDQRYEGRRLGLPRRQQPEVERQHRRHDHERQRGPLPGRVRRGHGQRHADGAVGLRHRRQPEVDLELTAPPVARFFSRGPVGAGRAVPRAP